ncbi:MAG: class I poly(R)-hydroxyalkanoic acid synthase, partial [Paraburkholderia caledonica]
MQQFFDAWLNAWRALGAAPGGNGTPFAMPQVPPAQGAAPWSLPQMPSFSGAFPGTFPASFPGLGSFPGFPGMPDFSKLAAGAMPAMPSLAGLNMPAAAIPPERLQKLQADYTREAMVLLQQASGNGAAPKAPELKDRRFSSDAWSSTPAFAFTAAWYLLNARYLQEMVDALEAEPKVRERIRFAVQQWTAAASPSNFLALNPEAQKTLLES